jgi:hypothetical protein
MSPSSGSWNHHRIILVENSLMMELKKKTQAWTWVLATLAKLLLAPSVVRQWNKKTQKQNSSLGSGPKRTQALTSIVELFSSLRVA